MNRHSRSTWKRSRIRSSVLALEALESRNAAGSLLVLPGGALAAPSLDLPDPVPGQWSGLFVLADTPVRSVGLGDMVSRDGSEAILLLPPFSTGQSLPPE